MDSESAFMRAPAEVRMLIYSYLFDDGGNSRLSLGIAGPEQFPKTDRRIRSRFHVMENRPVQRRSYETTYFLQTKGVEFCAALMRVNRTVYEETSMLVYARHAFDFGANYAVVQPFLSDLTPGSRALIGEMGLHKRGPFSSYEGDRAEWSRVCRFLQRECCIKKLRLVVQCGRPSRAWDGPREMTAAEFKLLADLKHESMEWATELAQVDGIEDVEVLPDIVYCPAPENSTMMVFAALTASMEKGLTEFLRSQLKLA